MARRFATRIGAIRADRFARIDSQNKNQRRRNDNINKICVLEGVGEGENSMTITFGNFANFIVRNFCHLGGGEKKLFS